MGGTHFLPRLVGASRALELIWSAEMIPAARCLELGLVNRVVPHADLAAETAAWAARLAALPPVAVRLVKGAIHDSGQRTLDESLAIEDSNQLQCFRSADAAEGLAAFGARRVPVFHGR
jgi:enoyl-CoA hydratase/carnithine racemase